MKIDSEPIEDFSIKKKLIVWLAIMLFCAGLFIFGIAYHNIDLSYNNKYTLTDMNPFGFEKTREEAYLGGLSGLITSTMLFMVSFWLLLYRRL
jgi:ABC-type Fe3+ transport system permease subunit